MRFAGAREHGRTGACLTGEEALTLQRPQRLAHGVATDAKAIAQLELCRKATPHGMNSGGDLFGKRLAQLFVPGQGGSRLDCDRERVIDRTKPCKSLDPGSRAVQKCTDIREDLNERGIHRACLRSYRTTAAARTGGAAGGADRLRGYDGGRLCRLA